MNDPHTVAKSLAVNKHEDTLLYDSSVTKKIRRKFKKKHAFVTMLRSTFLASEAEVSCIALNGAGLAFQLALAASCGR